MHPFSVGDLVICVDDQPLPGKLLRFDESWVIAGRVYRVSGTSTCPVSGRHGVVLEGLKNEPPSVGWHVWRFRKIEAADETFCRRLRQISDRARAPEHVS